jgi:hypothetical protein
LTPNGAVGRSARVQAVCGSLYLSVRSMRLTARGRYS